METEIIYRRMGLNRLEAKKAAAISDRANENELLYMAFFNMGLAAQARLDGLTRAAPPQIEDFAAVGERVKRVRHMLRLTQLELSRLLGINRKTLSRLETGTLSTATHCSPLIKLIAATLNVNEAWLLHGTGNPPDAARLYAAAYDGCVSQLKLHYNESAFVCTYQALNPKQREIAADFFNRMIDDLDAAAQDGRSV